MKHSIIVYIHTHTLFSYTVFSYCVLTLNHRQWPKRWVGVRHIYLLADLEENTTQETCTSFSKAKHVCI